MSGKKRRPTGEWRLPPSVESYRESAAEWRERRTPRPPLPKRRLILVIGLMFLGLCGVVVFWVPPHRLADDLHARGVTTTAEVIAAPRNRQGDPGNVRVRFDGPRGPTEQVLSDFGGMRPGSLRTGDLVLVVYDPQAPDRVLTADWVERPPVLTGPLVVTALMAVVFLAGTVALVLRRRWVLRHFGT
jgi:hypothetical protein